MTDVRRDQQKIDTKLTVYELDHKRPPINLRNILRLFDDGLLTPKSARHLLLGAAQQAIDDAESLRNALADATDEWTALDAWAYNDDGTTSYTDPADPMARYAQTVAD
jgi:hypothetical protein